MEKFLKDAKSMHVNVEKKLQDANQFKEILQTMFAEPAKSSVISILEKLEAFRGEIDECRRENIRLRAKMERKKKEEAKLKLSESCDRGAFF